MSLTTFYDYVKMLGLSRCLPANRRKKHVVGIRASRSGELLHMDSMVFRPLDHLRVYIHLIMDNYSRYILAHSAHEKLTATNTLATLEAALGDHRTVLSYNVDVLVMTDGGSENNLVPLARVRHLIAQKDISASNSMAEATNKSMKYCGVFCFPLADFQAVVAFLPKAINDYNNRPHTALFGLTPHEVFHGAIPDRCRYRLKIAEAVRNRLAVNVETHCRPEETPPCE